MARRKIGKVTTVKTNFWDYSYLLNGEGGIGKTSLVADLSRKLLGVEGMILLSIGREPLPDHIGGVSNERAKDWDDLEEIIDTIVEYKDEDYPNLKMVAIDSTDELFRLAEAKVVQMHNESVDSPQKWVKSVSAAFGGFQKGENKVLDIVTELLFKLEDVGVKHFFIGHTKKKNKKDIATDIEYELLTSNLDGKYYNCIKDKVNLVGTAYIERVMTDITTVKDAFTKGQKQVGRIESEERVISFRDEEYAVDNKSHFIFIPNKCKFDTDTYISTVMDAINKQSDYYNGLIPEVKDSKPEKDTKVKKEVVKEELFLEEEENEIVVDTEKNAELKAIIQKEMMSKKDVDKAAKVKEILKQYKAKSLDTSKPTAMFEEILNIFNN